MPSTSLLGLNVSNGEQRQVPPRVRFSLRTKFICFISLIIIATCSGLSWYVIQKQADSLSRSLVNTGTILVKNLAHNSRYGLFVEDQTLLGRLMEGVMDVDEVVYVVITGPEGRIDLINERAESLFRCSRDRLIGEPVTRLVPRWSSESKAPLDHQLLGVRADGSSFPSPDLAAKTCTTFYRRSRCRTSPSPISRPSSSNLRRLQSCPAEDARRPRGFTASYR